MSDTWLCVGLLTIKLQSTPKFSPWQNMISGDFQDTSTPGTCPGHCVCSRYSCRDKVSLIFLFYCLKVGPPLCTCPAKSQYVL